jgi:hypothetical protein
MLYGVVNFQSLCHLRFWYLWSFIMFCNNFFLPLFWRENFSCIQIYSLLPPALRDWSTCGTYNIKRACMVDYRESPSTGPSLHCEWPVLGEYASGSLRKYHCTNNIFCNVCTGLFSLSRSGAVFLLKELWNARWKLPSSVGWQLRCITF